MLDHVQHSRIAYHKGDRVSLNCVGLTGCWRVVDFKEEIGIVPDDSQSRTGLGTAASGMLKVYVTPDRLIHIPPPTTSTHRSAVFGAFARRSIRKAKYIAADAALSEDNREPAIRDAEQDIESPGGPFRRSRSRSRNSNPSSPWIKPVKYGFPLDCKCFTCSVCACQHCHCGRKGRCQSIECTARFR
jgi:hypothetical protein